MNQDQLWDAGRVIHKSARGRKVTCTCGTCRKCYARLYNHGIRRPRTLTERKGGVDKNGYQLVYLQPNDPMFTMTKPKSRTVLEHRLVMARHLGRPLVTDEIVHHRNGIKTDNRLSNLELWTRSHPNGQRVDEVLEWAKDFVRRYG